jgi:hypothetical protein
MPLVAGTRLHGFTTDLHAAVSARGERGPERLVVHLTPGAVGHAFPTGDLFRRRLVADEVVDDDFVLLARAERPLARHFRFDAGVQREISDDHDDSSRWGATRRVWTRKEMVCATYKAVFKGAMRGATRERESGNYTMSHLRIRLLPLILLTAAVACASPEPPAPDTVESTEALGSSRFQIFPNQKAVCWA